MNTTQFLYYLKEYYSKVVDCWTLSNRDTSKMLELIDGLQAVLSSYREFIVERSQKESVKRSYENK